MTKEFEHEGYVYKVTHPSNLKKGDVFTWGGCNVLYRFCHHRGWADGQRVGNVSYHVVRALGEHSMSYEKHNPDATVIVRESLPELSEEEIWE